MNQENFDNAVNSIQEFDKESQILIVDDDKTLLKFYKIHLNKFFSKIIVVDSASSALATIEKHQIDLIITDIRMPKMNGLQFIKKVQSKNPTIPTLVVSGAILQEKQLESLRVADGFIEKPFSIDGLNDFIRFGVELRFEYLQIANLLKDKKSLRKVLKKPERISSLISQKENLDKFKELHENLLKKIA